MDKIKDLVKDMSAGTTILVFLAVILATPVLLVLAVLWHAWAVAILWGMFMVPIFGLPVLGYWQAAGVCAVISTMKPTVLPEDQRKGSMVISRLILGPPLAVAFGYFYKYMAGM